jgi:putative two-component system response regulator
MNTPTQWFGDSAELTRMKVLVVDDEPANTALLQEVLAAQGYTRVECVCDSSVALDVCRSFDPDLILLDLMMPPPDGFTILDALRNREEENFLPIVVLTADTTDETRRRALEAGATDFLLKPFDLTEVALRIRNLLKSRRAHLLLDNQRAAFEDALRERTAELQEVIAQLRTQSTTLTGP